MIDDMEFRNLMKLTGKWLETPKAYILNPERMKLLEDTCNKLQAVLDAESLDCKITVSPCPLGSGDAIISFDAYDLTIRNIGSFYEAVKHLSNFEIYTTGDETIHFAGVFSKVAAVSTI